MTTDHDTVTSPRVIVTGATSGIGRWVARRAAERGATVTLAVRNLDRGERTKADIQAAVPTARVVVQELDLASLDSVRTFAHGYLESAGRLDVLINNAGAVARRYALTADGFEVQFGINHLGHFALTAHLWPALLSSRNGRVVTVSSRAHGSGVLHFEDLHYRMRRYSPMGAYAASKLANVLFANELARRLGQDRALSHLKSVAAHPGWAKTSIMNQLRTAHMATQLFAQPAVAGAAPIVAAAFDADVRSGQFVGVGGILHMRGPVSVHAAHAKAYDVEAARRLWAVSEALTGVEFSLQVPQRHSG